MRSKVMPGNLNSSPIISGVTSSSGETTFAPTTPTTIGGMSYTFTPEYHGMALIYCQVHIEGNSAGVWELSIDVSPTPAEPWGTGRKTQSECLISLADQSMVCFAAGHLLSGREYTIAAQLERIAGSGSVNIYANTSQIGHIFVGSHPHRLDLDGTQLPSYR